MVSMFRYIPLPQDNNGYISCSVINQMYPQQAREHGFILAVKCKFGLDFS